MLRLLVLITIISGVRTRGVPTADDNAELGPKGIKLDRKDHSSEYSTLTDCKDCLQNTDGKNGEGKILLEDESDKNDIGKDTENILLSRPKPQRSRAVKPSLTFHRINVNVNRNRNYYRKDYRNSNNGKQRHASRLRGYKEGNLNNAHHNTTVNAHTRRNTAKTDSNKSVGQTTTLSQKIKSKNTKDVTIYNAKEENAKTSKAQSIAGKDRDRNHRTESDSNHRSSNRDRTDVSSKNNAHAVNTDNADVKTDETFIAKSIDDKNEKLSIHKQEINSTSKLKQLSESKGLIDKSQLSKNQELKKLNPTGNTNLKSNGNTVDKTSTNFGDKIFKDTNNKHIDQDVAAGNETYMFREQTTVVSSIKKSKSGKNDQKETAKTKSESGYNERENKKNSLYISTEKPNDEKNVDYVLPRRLKDRWSRKGLSQVPDVERLERRLHPTVDAPVNDIIRSMKNMLRLIQSSLAKVDKDFVMIQNTTRWKYMLGVRNQLSELAQENDGIYDIVMESSLLTKQIYRQAHERKHPRSDIEAVAVAYRSRLNTNMNPQIRENFNAAQTELELAKQLIDQINSIQKQKDLLYEEEMRIQQLARDRLPMRTLHDLHRRADQTIRVLTAAQPLSRYGDRNKLYMHMRNDSTLNMRRANELIVEGFDLLMHAKHVLLDNRKKVQDHSRLMRNRLPAGSVSDMPFNSGRMELFVASDTANHHANSLAETAAEIHMKIVPLMKKAKEVIANNSGLKFKKRLEQSLDEMKETVKKLVLTLDEIRLVIGVEEIIEDRCEHILSGDGRFEFDRHSSINCVPYINLQSSQSSGDYIDGSGDDDDTFIDLEANITTLYKNITHVNATLGETFIDIDEPIPTDTVVDIDITESKESSIDIGKELSSVDIKADIVNETAKVSPFDVDISKPKKIISDSEIQKQTTESPESSTGKVLTKQDSKVEIKTTPVSKLVDTDDEDIAQELKRKMTKKTLATTTTTPATTTNATKKPAEGSDEDLFFDPFGWFNDEPDGNSVVIDSEYDKIGLTSVLVNMTLNEHIRQRLYNYSQDSKMLFDQAKGNKSKIDEISLTWQKVQSRFGHLENKTQSAKSLIIEWKANKAYFRSVHSRVKDAKKGMRLKKEVIEKQCKDAVDVADKKHKDMKKLHQKRTEKAHNAPDIKVVNETFTQVKVVLDNVKEINRLKQLYPNPCNILERLDKKIRTNITELRQKIERAKLIASTLQVAVAVPKKEYLEFPITSENQPLTSEVQMMFKHSGSDGRLMSLHVGEYESLSLDVESDTLKVVQTLDGDESSQTLYEEEIPDKWYLIQLQRFAASYNFTMFGENGLLRQVGFPSSSDSQRTFTPDLQPTSLRLGATGNDLTACALGFEINGRRINMFDMADNYSLLTPCSSQGKWKEQQLLLDGSGYAVVRLRDIKTLRSLQSIKISFNPRSDGTVIYLQPEGMSTSVDVYVENGFLVVFVHYRGFETKLKSTLQVYSQNHALEIKFTSGRTTQANVIFNGVSNIFKTAKGGKRKHAEDSTNILLGGLREENSSMVGCIKSLEVNNDIVPFHYISEAEGHTYGSCLETECVIFDANSMPIEITNLSLVQMIHVSIARGSLGPVLQFSKHKEKFNLEISLNTDGIHVEETVNDNSEDFSLNEDSEFITIAIKNDLKSKSLEVTIEDGSEDFSYKKGGGAWGGWGGGDKDNKKGDDGPVWYSVSIATASEDPPEFLGRVQNLIIDGRPMELLKYVDSNKLGRCTVNPTPREKNIKESTTRGISCQ